MKPKSILIIEDEHALGSALSLLITRMGHRPSLVASAAAGLEALERNSFDAAVIDIGLPDQSGLEVLESIRKSGSSMPVLVITAHATLQHALDSQKQGATAYMNKPLDMEQFRVQLESMMAPPKPVDTLDSMDTLADGSLTMIGAAPCLRDVFVGIAHASAGDFPVLIFGPGGSGKSLAARVIHAHGPGSGGPIMHVECSKLQSWSVQSGWVGATVVLEALEDLSIKAQSELAEFLQQQSKYDPRLIATMKLPPAEAIEQGRLREDLYFAFKPCSLNMPPLSERSSDIAALCHFFAGLKGIKGKVSEITPAVMTALQAHDWPGNIRELKHVMDYALSMSQGGALFLSHLPESVGAAETESSADGQLGTELELAIQRWVDQELAVVEDPVYDQLLQRLETELLNHLMRHFEEKPTRLANALNLHRGTLREKLKRIGWEASDQ